MTWILLICVYAKSTNATNSYSAIRFNSRTACESEAKRINDPSVKNCWNEKCTVWEVYAYARCVEDK